MENLRWKQRFENYKQALELLLEGVQKGDLNKFVA